LAFAEEAGLDFIMLSEHNTNSGLTLYGSVQPDFPKLLIVRGGRADDVRWARQRHWRD
jgi:hypothetical protein